MTNRRPELDIIQDIKLFGILLYRRHRLRNEEVHITAAKSSFEHPCIWHLSEDIGWAKMNRKEGSLGEIKRLFEKKHYKAYLHKIFRQTIVNLLMGDRLSLFRFQDQKSILWCIRWHREGYHLVVKDDSFIDDHLSRALIEFSKSMPSRPRHEHGLRHLLHSCINYYIGQQEYGNPWRELFLELAVKTTRLLDEIRISRKKNIFGAPKGRSIYLDMDDQMKNKLITEQKDYDRAEEVFLKNNPWASPFLHHVREEIDRDLKSRIPDQSGD